MVAETHPLYMGLYSGALGREEITKYVEGSDCVLMLGTFMTDINLGIYTAELDMSDCIFATSEQLRIRHHHFHDVTLPDFVKTLAARKPRPKAPPPKAPTEFWKRAVHAATRQERITITRMIDRLDEQLDDETIVIADVGDALFASTELTTRGRTEFLSPAYYTSMGFAVPAALGVHMGRPAARVGGDRRRRRVSDDRHGALEPRAAQVSGRRDRARQRRLRHREAAAPRRLGVQRRSTPGSTTNCRRCSAAARVTRCAPRASSTRRSTAAWQDTSGPSILHVHLDPTDFSQALARLAERMSKTVVQ